MGLCPGANISPWSPTSAEMLDGVGNHPSYGPEFKLLNPADLY